MSIWSTFAEIEPLYPLGYGFHHEEARTPIPDSYIGLADANSWYGNDAIRVSGQKFAFVLARPQAKELRDALTAWLEAHP